MKQIIITGCVVIMMLFALTSSGQAQDAVKKIKVGVYDNRAIALAYFGSEHNEFIKKRAEVQEARATGDTARVKELDVWVGRFQRQLHFQGFCRVPVDDLLLLVKEKMAEVVKSTGVDLISWQPDYFGADVEIIDITDELVALFNPTEAKLEQIKGLKDVEPTALCDVNHDE